MFSGPAESYPHLLGDIGGTNARFGLIVSPGAEISRICSLRCADFPDPLALIRHYLAQNSVHGPRHAAIGIANPVSGDFLRMTNTSWSFSVSALREALGFQTLIFLNDFSALAMSLPYLQSGELKPIGEGKAKPGRAIAVIGPGTGLGVSGLIPVGAGYLALSGEGGHVSLSPATQEEFAVTACLQREYGHVSAERVLSGPGLVVLHQALAVVRGQAAEALNAAAITDAGLEGMDGLCADALSMFCALLGSVAGNLALTLGAQGGVFVGGGIVPRLGVFFERSAFRQRFEEKGRFKAYLSEIPANVILAAQPALTGAAVALSQALAAESA